MPLPACVALVLALGAAAQDARKVAVPLPPVDLDDKVSAPVAGPSVPGPGKPDLPALPPDRGLPHRNATPTAVLPGGGGFRLGLPPGEIVFDAGDGRTIWAEGANYKASIAGGAFTYVPFFGSEAPRDYPVAFRLQAATLGSATLLSAAAPQRRGNSVTIDHGSVTERYDLYPDRVEQRFEIAAPFRGDLSLTLDVATELSVERDGGGLRFGNALGHVGYTAAVLVDARGRRFPMTTEYADGRIALRAAARSLADAAFPVTVDPVLTTFAVAASSYVLLGPDIAYAESSGHYLVVWVRVYSATDPDVHAIAIDRNGAVVPGSSSLIDNSTDRWDQCRVALCGPNFLVVATRQAQGGGARAIWGRTRAAGTATMGLPFEISGTENGDKVAPDVGGEFDAPVNFCVVWQRNYTSTDHDIHYRMVTAAGAVSGAVGFIDNAGGNDDYRPRIAKSDGTQPAASQLWPVVWERTVAGQTDIHGARVAWDGTLATPPFAIDAAASDDDTQPVPSSLSNVLGGARYFVVAYTTSRAGNLDIFLRAYRDGATPVNVSTEYLATVERLTIRQRADDQHQARVDTDGSTFAITYLEGIDPNEGDAYVSTVDLAPLLRAVDSRVTLTISPRDTNDVALVANRSGGGVTSLDYGAAWGLLADGIYANWIEGAIYRGVVPAGVNCRLRARRNPAPGATLSENHYAGVWGMVHNGRELAILPARAATYVYDCTDPAAPVLLGSIAGAAPATGTYWREATGLGNHAYVGSEHQAVQAIDISGPVPVLVGTFGDRAHTVSIDAGARRLWVNGGALDGSRIYDVAADPVQPPLRASYLAEYVHDCYPYAGYCYLAQIAAGNVRILDTRNFPTLTTVSTTATPSQFTHNVWTNEDATLMVTTDERLEGCLTFYDITNKAAPVQLSQWCSPAGATVHNAFLRGKVCHVAAYAAGYYAVDVSEPANPRLIASYDTNASNGPYFTGCWGCYPLQPSGNVYLADMENGFFVVEPTCGVPVHYGLGTAGTGGKTPVVDYGGGFAQVGRTTFRLECTQMAANAPAVLLLGSAAASIPLLGITLAIDVTQPHVLLPGSASADGKMSVPVPLPGHAGAAGASIYAQVVTVDAGGPLGLAASRGFRVAVCP